MLRHDIPIVVGGRAQVAVLASPGLSDAAQRGVELLRSEIARRTGAQVPVVAACTDSGRLPLIVIAEAGERTPPEALGDNLGVAAEAEGLSEEGYIVCCEDGSPACIRVLGGGGRGVIYGVGALLRMVRFDGGETVAQIKNVRSEPETSLRGHLLANHLWSPQYDNWSVAQWDSAIADLALWGVNTILCTPGHLGEWAAVDPWADPPRFDDPSVKAMWERFWPVQLQLPALARGYGMDFGIWIPVNDVFVDRAVVPEGGEPGRGHPGLAGRCDNTCPSDPQARQYLLWTREQVFRRFPVDIVVLPASDCGGCQCSRCQPWVQTYFELARETAAIVRKYSPQAKIALSNQNLPEDEEDWLCGKLSAERPDWVQFVCHGPGSRDLRTMRERLPETYGIVLYPDITHLTSTPGYFFDGFSPDPLLVRVYNAAHLEATHFVRARAIAGVYPEARQYAVGSFPYSEGTHDDLNKVVWTQLEWNPHRPWEEIVQEYCSFYFGAPAASEVASIEGNLELIMTEGVDDNPRATENLTRLQQLRESLPPWALHSWRWEFLEFRVLADRFLQLHLKANRAVEGLLRTAVDSADPAHLVRDLAVRLGEAGPRPVLDDLRLDLGVMFPYFASAREALEERRRGFPPQHPPSAQDLSDLTPVLQEMEELDHRLQALAWSARRRIGWESRAAWILRGAKTLFDRTLEELAELATSEVSPEVLVERIRLALEPPDRAPHIEAATNVDYFPDLFLSDRLEAERCVRSAEGSTLRMVYPSVDPATSYVLEITYLQARHESRRQRLWAGGILLHGPILLPAGQPRTHRFLVPAEAYASGELVLTVERVSGWPHSAVVSEARLVSMIPSLEVTGCEGPTL